MKRNRFLFLSIIIAFIFFTGCSKDDTKVVESQVLAEYLESTDSPLGKDFVNTDLPTIISASDVHTLNLTGQIYIIDIRSSADFANGHIENAVNVAFGDLLTHVKSTDLSGYEKIAIVCYTGQTAGYGACLLRLMGYDNVYSMKWGMCSWNSNFATSWKTSIGNTYATQFVTTATAKNEAGDLPVLNTGKTTGQEILEARAATVFSEGFDPAKITNATVFGSLSNYYIVNYWPENHYAIGHIPGAVQYTPKATLTLAADLKTLPTDKPIVVYCYTGQTSAFITAYLRLLGYDAKSLLFGTNGMIYDIMAANSLTIFSDAQIMGYDYVTK